MAEVTGFIGGDAVNLENAATEATLRALLASSQTSAGAIRAIAVKMGVAESALESFEAATASANTLARSTTVLNGFFGQLSRAGQDTANSFNAVDRNISPLIGKFIQGTASVKDVTDAFGKLNPILGIVTTLFGRIVSYQEENLKAYQTITNAGASFSGSLTDLRLAAANSYVTLSEFSKVLTDNRESFIRIGGSVNEGAVAFSKFSHGFIDSNLGAQMLGLGYTTEQLNQYLATYVGNAGASSTKDLATNKQLRDGAAGYLEELDRLAQVTGKTRDELNEQRKVKNLEADAAITAARMKPKEREAFLANYNYMKEMYGAAGQDIALAQAQGRSVITKEGAMLTAVTGGAVTTAMQHLSDTGKLYGVGSKEYIQAQNEMTMATQNGIDRIPTAVFSANEGIKNGLGQTLKTVADQQMAGLNSQQALEERDKKIAADKIARENSQAEQMALANRAMQQTTQALIDLINPIVSFVTPYIRMLAEGIRSLVLGFTELNNATRGLLAVLAVAGIGTMIYKNRGRMGNAASKATDALKSGIGGMGLRGYSEGLPLYVQIVSGGLAGAVADAADAADAAKTAEKGAAGASKKAAAIAAAKSAAKRAGIAGAVISGLMLTSDLSDINKKEKSGELNKAEASKARGGAVGEAGGGLAGGIAGAAAGAAIGSVVPVIGTAVGGIVGGIIGGFGGGSIGKSIGEWWNSDSKSSDASSKASEEDAKTKKAKEDKEKREIETLEQLRKQTELLMNSHNQLQQQTEILDGVNNNTNNFRPSWIRP